MDYVTPACHARSKRALSFCNVQGWTDASMKQAVKWLTSSDRSLGFEAFGEELELADRILEFVQGDGFRPILDGPLAVIQLQPNDGLKGRRNLHFRHQRPS